MQNRTTVVKIIQFYIYTQHDQVSNYVKHMGKGEATTCLVHSNNSLTQVTKPKLEYIIVRINDLRKAITNLLI